MVKKSKFSFKDELLAKYAEARESTMSYSGSLLPLGKVHKFKVKRIGKYWKWSIANY